MHLRDVIHGAGCCSWSAAKDAREAATSSSLRPPWLDLVIEPSIKAAVSFAPVTWKVCTRTTSNRLRSIQKLSVSLKAMKSDFLNESHSSAAGHQIGAELQPNRDGVNFRVWAPRRRRVEIVLTESGTSYELSPESNGCFSGLIRKAGNNSLYSFRLDNASDLYPDPASRFQPFGPHGPSQVIDPSRFCWTDNSWPGLSPKGQIVYEMHIGTFTREGTYAAAMRELPELAAAGITVLEVMPLADFAGDFGWGYDGVDMFAPTRLYGLPDDLRSLSTVRTSAASA